MAEERNFRKVRRGYVVSDKMDKTITVELEQRSTHPLYGKVVRSTSKVKAHDEHNDAHIGDLVSIMETRPLSKTKRWRYVKTGIHASHNRHLRVRQGSPFTGALWATTMPR